MAQTTFIHGQSKATSIRNLLKDARDIVIISGYVTEKGLEHIRPSLKQCISAGGTATLVFGLDRAGVATPALVRALGKLLRTRVSGTLRVFLVPESAQNFLHAKVYFARHPHSAEMIVGSLNLTGRGLSSNHELAIRVSGRPGALQGELQRFLQTLPGVRELRPEDVEPLARTLEKYRGGDSDEDPERARQRREQRKNWYEKINDAVPRTGDPSPPDPISGVEQLLAEGAFWGYELDIKKLTVPSGLSSLYDMRILDKETLQAAGTARLRVPSVSASFPLLPEDIQRRYTSLARRMGKAFSRFGFETPFGYWIPETYQDALQKTIRDIAKTLPHIEEIEKQIHSHLDKHRRELAESIERILTVAARGGFNHPSKWRVPRSGTFRELYEKGQDIPEAHWKKHPLYRQVRTAVREKLMEVESKLDADLAIGKLQRLRPRPFSLDISLTAPAHVSKLLECLAWSVAEDRTDRATRRAVRHLAGHCRIPHAQRIQELTRLSDALTESTDDHERALAVFFTIFGTPPYWVNAVAGAGEAAEDEDA